MTEAPELAYYDPPEAPFATQRSAARAAFSNAVGHKLDTTANMWRLGASVEKPIQLYTGDEFLSSDECVALAQKIDAGAYPSTLYEQEKHAGVRTSQSCNLDAHDPLVGTIDRRIATLMGIDPRFGEPLQGQRYEVGQEFKPHADFFYVDQPYWEDYAKHGGQRTWTAMIYLISPESGGGTGFPLLRLGIAPRRGRILIWNNMALDGSPNGWTVHAGEPVAAGVKYIVTKWFRERPFA